MTAIRYLRPLALLSAVALGVMLVAAALTAAQNGPPRVRADLSRNSVNLTDKNPPLAWNVEEGKQKNIKWVQTTGGKGYCAPVVAGGRVFVSTANNRPRDPKVKGKRAVLMCFAEQDGKFLWQNVHAMAPPEVDQQGETEGLCSTPSADGDRVYYITPGCIVVCADVATGKIAWTYDLMKQLKVYPCITNSCRPLIVGDLVYVVTGNGTGNMEKVAEPKAPSFVALDKKAGTLKWQSALPGEKIIYGQWGSPAYAEVDGKGQVLFPGGDGVLYSLEPLTGELIWKFRCIPVKGDKKEQKKPNYLVATPTVQGQRVYIGVGYGPDTPVGNPIGHLWCIDITKKGDVSPKNDNFDPKAPENKDSALVWHYGGTLAKKDELERTIQFGPTISSCAVQDGLLYAIEDQGFLHCLDAQTGKRQWVYDLSAGSFSAPYWVAGKVYAAADDGSVRIFAHGRKMNLLATADMDTRMESTPVVVNNVLYVATTSKLYAIGAK